MATTKHLSELHPAIGDPAQSAPPTQGPGLGAYLPMLGFASVYTVTCLLGAVLILVDYHPFVALYRYFSGQPTPSLNTHQLRVDMVLLLLAPVLLIDGFVVATRLPLRPARLRKQVNLRLETPSWLPWLVFTACALWATVELISSGTLLSVSSWFHYSAWIAARERAFQHMSFFDFTNIYLFVPVSAAWVLITSLRDRDHAQWTQAQRATRFLLRWAPTLIALAFTLLIFQRKAALVALLIIVPARLLYARGVSIRRRRRQIVALVAAVGALYIGAVVTPVISNTPAHVPINVGAIGNAPALVLYTTLSPLTRTSAPALFYPIVFPRHHPYFGLDLGQDVIGLGRAPNDNRVVWSYLNPNSPVGTIAAPYQFVLYSQVGWVWTLVLSAVLGLICGLGWRAARAPFWPREWSSILQSLVLLLGIYLAIESARNSVLVSYGVLWPVLFVLAMAALVHGLNRLAEHDALMARVVKWRERAASLRRAASIVVLGSAKGALVWLVALPDDPGLSRAPLDRSRTATSRPQLRITHTPAPLIRPPGPLERLVSRVPAQTAELRRLGATATGAARSLGARVAPRLRAPARIQTIVAGWGAAELVLLGAIGLTGGASIAALAASGGTRVYSATSEQSFATTRTLFASATGGLLLHEIHVTGHGGTAVIDWNDGSWTPLARLANSQVALFVDGRNVATATIGAQEGAASTRPAGLTWAGTLSSARHDIQVRVVRGDHPAALPGPASAQRPVADTLNVTEYVK